jgi:sugar porter (SP) family MFS transporter
MDQDDHVPLQEVVYKATTQDNTSAVLKPDSKSQTAPFLYFAALIANLLAFTSGIAFGWTSPVLPKLMKSADADNPLGRVITQDEASWIAGLVCLGAIFGPLVAGAAADKFGRKRTLQIVAFPMAISLVMAAYAKTVLLLYISRTLLGIGVGSVFTVLPMYLGEIAEDHNRGALGCSFGAFMSLGLLFSFLVGPFLSVCNFCLVSVVPLIIFISIFSMSVPETPQFLASVNKTKELESSLTKLRKKSYGEIQKELANIDKSIAEESQNKGGIGDLFKFKGLRKGLVITLGIIALQQLAGINPVLAYMQTIFDAAGSGLAPEISTIIIGAVQTLAMSSTYFLVDRLGRRILLVSSALGSSLSLLALGFYFYRKSHQYNVEAISWLPVSSLVSFIITFNIGLGPLPWAVMAELFPPNVKSVASSLTSFTCFGTGFLITLFFPTLSHLLGMAQSFWICATVCLIGAIFVYFMLPETKGKSIQEIQKLLEGNKT